MVGSGGAFVLSLVNSFKRVISPALVLVFAALEGVALGAFSKFFEYTFVAPGEQGLVLTAVIGTFAAFAGTLAAYKFFNIKVEQQVPHRRDRCGVRHGRAQPASRWCSASSASTRGSSASARSA